MVNIEVGGIYKIIMKDDRLYIGRCIGREYGWLGYEQYTIQFPKKTLFLNEGNIRSAEFRGWQ